MRDCFRKLTGVSPVRQKESHVSKERKGANVGGLAVFQLSLILRATKITVNDVRWKVRSVYWRHPAHMFPYLSRVMYGIILLIVISIVQGTSSLSQDFVIMMTYRFVDAEKLCR